MILEVDFLYEPAVFLLLCGRDTGDERNYHIGDNAAGLDGSVIGGIIPGSGHTQPGTIWKGDNCLNGAFAKGLSTDNNTALVILYCSCYDFRGAGRAFINKNHEGVLLLSAGIVGREDSVLVLFTAPG